MNHVRDSPEGNSRLSQDLQPSELAAATLDVKLRERLLQGELGGRRIIGQELLSHDLPRALDGLFDRIFIDLIGAESHVGEDGDPVLGDLNDPGSDRQRSLRAILQIAELSRLESGYDGGMGRKDSE